MSVLNSSFINLLVKVNYSQSARSFTLGRCVYLDQQWREKKSLPANPNKQRELLDLPDYSYLDGRPTPYGSRQKLRIMKQREYSKKIIELTKEMDFAIEHYKTRMAKQEKEKEEILGRKLEPKGVKKLD
ncbi:hypothetical protein O3M35_011694 [Rhynocoris fuscipes]|uniref:Large ribosomal subunit protein mL52 n=1 Tax=Rhynocoris fuscipes TaxID=488301 RepID=A0AAW1CX58_9HEMI